jgi:hypothetical protein
MELFSGWSYQNASGFHDDCLACILATPHKLLRYNLRKLNVIFNCNTKQSVPRPHRRAAVATLFCYVAVWMRSQEADGALPVLHLSCLGSKGNSSFTFLRTALFLSPTAGHYIVWQTEHSWIPQSSNSNIKSYFFSMASQPLGGLGLLSFRGFTITHIRHTTLCRTPLDKWSDRRRDLYLTTHNTHKRQTSMPPAQFEPAVTASGRP